MNILVQSVWQQRQPNQSLQHFRFMRLSLSSESQRQSASLHNVFWTRHINGGDTEEGRIE